MWHFFPVVSGLPADPQTSQRLKSDQNFFTNLSSSTERLVSHRFPTVLLFLLKRRTSYFLQIQRSINTMSRQRFQFSRSRYNWLPPSAGWSRYAASCVERRERNISHDPPYQAIVY